MANRNLRQAKMAAHTAFDPLWRNGAQHRRRAYAWLAEQLDIAEQDCHIGLFDIEICHRVVAVCKTAIRF